MQRYERKQLLERAERESATIGASIPDEIEVQNREFPLREFVFEVKRLDSVPAEKREEVAEAKKLLRRERNDRKERLEAASITKAEGEEIVEAIVGIDRALNALESLGPTNIEREARAKEAADTKRWYSFVGDVLGWDDGKNRHTR